MGIGCHAWSLSQSPTLAANERVQAKLAAGEDVLHLAFGEAGLPVLPAVAERLAEGAGRNGYGPVAGSAEAREAAAGYFERRGLPTDAAARSSSRPGSKPLLYALLQALPGDVVLPAPCWVSYAAHAALAGKRVIRVPIGAEAGGVPDPAALRAALAEASGIGARPGVLVLTLPDNPTGTVASAALVREVCAVADAAGLLIVCDEIYRDLAHDPDAFVSPAEVLPERTFVTTGLSKHMALGGWRVGLVRLADGAGRASEAGAAIGGLASEIWSALAAPMQHAAAYVLSEPPEMVEHVAASRRLHRAVTTAAYDVVIAARRARAARRAAPSTSIPSFAGAAVRQRRRARRPPARASTGSPCWPARRSATTPPRCASASPPACSTATPTSASSRRCAATTRRRCRGSRQRSSGCGQGLAVAGLPGRLDDVAVGVADLDADVVGLVPELGDLDARRGERVAHRAHRRPGRRA